MLHALDQLSFSPWLCLSVSEANVIFGKPAASRLIAVAQLSAGLQTLRDLFGSLCFLDVNCTARNPTTTRNQQYSKATVSISQSVSVNLVFLKQGFCTCYICSVLSLGFRDGFCRGTRLLEALLGFVLSHSVLLRLSFSLGPTFRVVTATQLMASFSSASVSASCSEPCTSLLVARRS